VAGATAIHADMLLKGRHRHTLTGQTLADKNT